MVTLMIFIAKSFLLFSLLQFLNSFSYLQHNIILLKFIISENLKYFACCIHNAYKLNFAKK